MLLPIKHSFIIKPRLMNVKRKLKFFLIFSKTVKTHLIERGDVMSLITDNIDAIVSEKGIKKGEFYAAVDISAQTYSQWKNEQTQPSLKNIYRIAEYLGVEVYVLFLKDGQKKTAAPVGDGLTDAQKSLLAILSSLDSDGVRYIIEKAREVVEFQRFRDSQ